MFENIQVSVSARFTPSTRSLPRQHYNFRNCRATCVEGYHFSKGVTNVTFVCDGSKYKVKGSTNASNAVPSCVRKCRPSAARPRKCPWPGPCYCVRLAVCDPPCENGGVCEKPNRCNCPGNYGGPSCERYDSSRYCHGFPSTPANSKKKCDSEWAGNRYCPSVGNDKKKPLFRQGVHDRLRGRPPVSRFVHRGPRVLQKRRLDTGERPMADRSRLPARVRPAVFKRRQLRRLSEMPMPDRLQGPQMPIS